jgi:hypothetical protein
VRCVDVDIFRGNPHLYDHFAVYISSGAVIRLPTDTMIYDVSRALASTLQRSRPICLLFAFGKRLPYESYLREPDITFVIIVGDPSDTVASVTCPTAYALRGRSDWEILSDEPCRATLSDTRIVVYVRTQHAHGSNWGNAAGELSPVLDEELASI